MTEPIVFVSHFKVKAGGLEGLRDLAREVSRQLDLAKPRTLLFLNYLNADADRATFIHAFADAESMDRHFEGAGERSKRALEFLEPDGWEIYGTPSDSVVETMRQAALTSGTTLRLEPEYLAGFLRIGSG